MTLLFLLSLVCLPHLKTSKIKAFIKEELISLSPLHLATQAQLQSKNSSGAHLPLKNKNTT
jgi:hypothetical protein